MEKMTIEKAREIIKGTYDMPGMSHKPFPIRTKDYCLGFIEAWESCQAEVDELKKKLLRKED